MRAVGSRWDWYEATFDDMDEGFMPTSLGLIFAASVTRGRARNGYAVGHVIERDGTVLAQVHERSARPGEVHVTVTSDACDEVVPVLRSRWPIHRVSRADSAVDFTADFSALDSRVLAFATERGLTHELFTNSDGGATRYVGARSSEVRMLLYKKTEELRSQHPERADSIPDGVVRFELRNRPGKRQAKETLALASSDDAWGFSQWSAELASLILSIDAERTSTHFRRPTDFQRASHFMGKQYGPTFTARVAEVGLAQAQQEALQCLGLGALVG